MKYQATPEDLVHEPIRGELFNALAEAAPALVRTVASRLGVPLGALRKMANEGKLTSAVLLAAAVAQTTKFGY
jgi:phage-related minor tail protein